MDARGRIRVAAQIASLTIAMLVPSVVDLSEPAAASHAAWLQGATFPVHTWNMAVAWTGSEAFVLGGYDGQTRDSIRRYVPSADTLDLMGATLPVPVYAGAAIWDGQAVYLLGGYVNEVPSGQIVRYRPNADEAETMAEVLPRPTGFASVVWDPRDRQSAGCPAGCAYLFGGTTSGGGPTDGILRYNPATDTAATMTARLPSARDGTSALWDGSFAYVVGGRGGGPDLDEIVRYDPLTDAVTSLSARLPIPSAYSATAVVGSHGFVLGGHATGGHLTTIFDIDLVAGTATQLAARLPGGVAYTGAITDGASVFIVGGNAPDAVVARRILRFAPGPDHPPVARIVAVGPVECAAGRGSVVLNGFGSFDPDGETIAYDWSSPADVTFDTRTTPTPVASAAFGTSPVKLRAIDGALSDTTTTTVQVIDTRPPSTTHSFTGLRGNGEWWRSPVDVELRPTDSCGIATTYFGLPPAQSSEGTHLTIEGDGRHDLEYRSVDLGGNTEPTALVPVDIDATPPEVAIDDPIPGNAYVNGAEDPLEDPMTHTIVVGTKSVRATAADVTSLVARVEFLVDGDLRATILAPGPYEFTWNAGDEAAGGHVLGARAYDVAGNNATTEMDVVTAPTSQQGLLATADPIAACRVVLGETQCDDAEKIADGDVNDALDVLRDRINEFLRECEETLSRTFCALLPDELPGGPTASPPSGDGASGVPAGWESVRGASE